MRKAEPIVNNFTGGEVSPKLDARSDLQKYYTACRTLENMIPYVEGGAQARPGLYFVAEVKDSTKKVRLFPFQFNTEQAYIIEAGENYFRFYKDNARILDGMIPYEVASEYQEEDLYGIKVTQSADIFYLAHRDYCMRKLSRTGHTAWTFTRFIAKTGGDLTITDIEKTNPCKLVTAYGEPNDYPEDGETVFITGVSGMTELNDKFFTAKLDNLIPFDGDRGFLEASHWENVTLPTFDDSGCLSIQATAGEQYCKIAEAFIPTDIGKKYRLTFKAKNSSGVWSLRSYNGTQTFGDVEGDGEHVFNFIAKTAGGLRFRAMDEDAAGDYDDFSLVELGPFKLQDVDATSYTAYTTGGTAVTSQFGTTGDNPGAIAFFEQRFMAGGTDNDPLDFYGSASSDFENFYQDEEDASSAVQYSLLSDKVDAIKFMIGEEYLLVGTMGSIWRVGASSSTEALSMDNIRARRQDAVGVQDMDAEMVHSSVIFVQGGSTTVRRAEWDFYKDKYETQDLTRIAKHITLGSSRALSGIVDMDYQSEPMSILWAVRADGTLLGMTYEPAENVFAWFRVITDGEFESVAVISNEGDEDQVWVSVKRTINGVEKRYIEYFMPHEYFGNFEDAFFVDSGLTWKGKAAVDITWITQANQAIVSAAGHEFTNGMKVQITGVVGMTQANQDITEAYTVANSIPGESFELSGINSSAWSAYTSGGSVIQVANSFTGADHLEGETVAVLTDAGAHPDIDIASGTGTLTWYANAITVGLPYTYNLEPMKIEPGSSIGGTSRGKKKKIVSASVAFYESSGAKWGPDADNLFDVSFGLGGPPELFTGDKETDFDMDYDTEASVYIQGRSPLPLTVLSVAPVMVGE
jgi:hypothetical protein